MQRSEAKRSENGARTEFIYQTSSRVRRSPGRLACTKQGWSTGVHKHAQGSSVNRPVDRSRTVARSVDRLVQHDSQLDSVDRVLGSVDRLVNRQANLGAIWISFQDSDFVSELESNPIGVF